MKNTHNPNLTPNARTLRKEMTKEERHLWYDFLKNYPVMVHRQKVVDRHIVDFYIAKAALVIELDGSQHFEREGALADQQRDAYLETLGLKVLRIPNNAVNQNFPGVCQYIDLCVKERIKPSP